MGSHWSNWKASSNLVGWTRSLGVSQGPSLPESRHESLFHCVYTHSPFLCQHPWIHPESPSKHLPEIFLECKSRHSTLSPWSCKLVHHGVLSKVEAHGFLSCLHFNLLLQKGIEKTNALTLHGIEQIACLLVLSSSPLFQGPPPSNSLCLGVSTCEGQESTSAIFWNLLSVLLFIYLFEGLSLNLELNGWPMASENLPFSTSFPALWLGNLAWVLWIWTQVLMIETQFL